MNFRVVTKGQANKVYAIEPWPEEIEISEDFFDERPAMRSGDTVTIRVENGFAEYKETSSTAFLWHGKLARSEYTEPDVPVIETMENGLEHLRQASQRLTG